MNKKNYNVEGYNKPFTVTEDKEKEFLAWAKENNKQYELSSEDLGKQSSSAADATAEQTTTASTQEVTQPQKNQQTDTDSKLDLGSLESRIVNNEATEEEKEQFIKNYEAEYLTIDPRSPKAVKDKINNKVKSIAEGTANLGAGWFKAIASYRDPKEIGKTLVMLKNVKDNIPENLMTAAISTSSALADAFTADLDGLGHNEKQKAIRQKAENYMIDSFEKLDKMKNEGVDIFGKEFKRKDIGKGIVGGLRAGSGSDYVAGLFNAITSTAETVIPAIATRGLSIPFQIGGPMYVDYNEEKAKRLYGDDPEAMDKLIESGQTELKTPLITTVFATALEGIGFKGITSYMRSIPGKSGELARLARPAFREGFTELFQGGTEKINSSLGAGKSIQEASVDALNHMMSDEGLEEFFNGFVGGGAVSAGGKLINKGLTSDNASVKEIDDQINNIADLDSKKNMTRNKEVKDALDLEINDAKKKLKDYINNKRNLSKVLTKDQQSTLINTLNQKDEIVKKVEALKSQLKEGAISNKEYGYAIRSLNGQDKKLSNQISEVQNQAMQAAAQRTTESVKKQITDMGLEGKVTEMTSEEISKLDEEGLDSKSAATSFGFIKQNLDGTFEIILNKDKPMVGTAAHEFMHAILFKTLGNNSELQTNLGDALEQHVTTLGGDLTNVGKRLAQYGKWTKDKEGNITGFKKDANFGEETITIMSESILDGSLKFNEGFFTKIGDIVRRFSQNYLGKEITFNTGRDVFNFIKDYNNSIKTGKINKAIVKVAKEGAKGKLVEKKTETVAEKTTTQMSKDVSPNINEMGRMAWTNDTWKETGANFAIEEMRRGKMLDGLILAAQAKANPSVQIKNQNEKVKERFVNDVYAQLTSHVKNFKPEDQGESGLFGWINPQLGNKALDVQKRPEYSPDKLTRAKDITEKTEEGAPVIQVEADTQAEMDFIDQIGLTEKQSERYSKLRKKLKLDDNMINKVRDAVIKTFGTKLPDIDSKKFKAELEKRFRTELKKPIQDMIGSRDNYDKFLETNFEAVYNALPVETLIQMERSIKPEQRIFTTSKRITKPTEVDRLISQGRLPKNTNRLAGPQLHNKNKYPGKDKVLAFFRGVDMENQLGYKVSGSTLGTRKDKLAMEIGVELAFDATSETIQDPDVQEKRRGILSLQGQEQASNELAVIAKQINRDPSIKFSRSIEQGAEFYKDSLDLVNAIAAKGDLSGIINMKALKDGRYVGLGRYKDIPPVAIKYVINEIYLKDKQFLNTGKLLNRISKGIKAGDARSKGFEQFIIDRFAKIPGVKLIFEKQSEEGVDIPDVYGTLYGQPFNVEVKLFDAQVSSLTINDINVSRGTIVINKLDNLSKKNKDKVDKLVNKTIPVLRDIKKRLKGLTKNPEATKRDVEILSKWNSPKDLMPDWAHKILKSEGYFKKLTQVGVFDQSLIEELYLNKAIPTNYIYMLGKGFFHLKSDVLNINSPKLEGTFLAPIRQVKASQYKSINGVKTKTGYVTMNMRLLPTVGEVTSKSNMDIIDNIDAKKFINKDVQNLLTAKQKLNNVNSIKKSLTNKIKYSKSSEAKGMSTFDFDETVGVSENFIIAKKGKEKKRIASNEWPFVGEQLENEGWTFDFSDFNKVTKGKPGPLFQKMKNQIKKYGPENVFILTARNPQSEQAIHDWLKSNDINIPRKNVTGLGNSTGQAKADWMLEKFAEGYNDMYFVDDAITNVEAVKNVLEQLDIKSKVVQAKIKFSKDASKDFNDMLERTKGVNADKIISQAAARSAGQTKGRFEFFIPPSAEDFKGLIYRFLGKGKQGETDLAWFKENLFTPFAKAIRAHDTYRQNMANEWRQLKKNNPKVVEILNKKVKGTDFTNDTAVRVYLWDKAGFQIPGLSEQEQKVLVDKVNKDKDLKNFAEALGVISRRPDGYLEPDANWVVQTTATDLNTITSRVGRREFLQEWIENKDVIFSEQNLNKIQAIYGTSVRTALEGILYRMEFGTNRTVGKDANVNLFLDWINGSVGATMFFNMRSAILQTISTVNFINMSDNNLFKAAAAFANQPQFWKDFSFLFNSDMLKQRRAGLQTDVNAAELTKTFTEGGTTSIDKIRSVIRYMLQKGFLPTQIADSFAIASGGASFYRNKIKKYVKEGMSENKAKEQAFLDFQEIAEETQQSSRPDLISEQQAGVLGRLILAWQNTPMQMTRLTKKAISDLVNNRGDAKANISKILYYGFIQNIIFGTLQSGLAFLLFGNDEEEDKVKLKTERVLNGALDTVLRGTGIYGAAASTLKNTIRTWQKEKQKDGWKRENLNIAQAMVDLSPPMGSKMRKIMNAVRTEQYNKGVGEKIGFRIENPYLSMAANVVEAGTNIPLARLVSKANNLEEAVTGNHQLWQRVAMGAGWSRWSVNVKDEELEKAKAEVKQDKKDKTKANKDKKKQEEKAEKAKVKKQQEEKEKKEGVKEVRCSGRKSNGKRCSIMVKTNAKTAKCMYHKTYKPNEASDRDGDGVKEYRCVARKANGQRCKNRTENKNKKCYAHNK